MESLEDMQQRHRKEAKDLLGHITGLRKSIGKGAADKKKKKEVQDQITQMEKELETRHKSELAHLQAQDSVETQSLVESVEEISLNQESKVETKKPNRQQKRKENKKAAMEAMVRQAEQEASQTVDKRQLEADEIKGKLDTMNLIIKEIQPDGHCLYNAIAHQLNSGKTYSQIRSIAAEYMRAHQDDFWPFMTDDRGDMLSPDQYTDYCDKIEKTAEWGGQLEIQALSKALLRQIHIVQMGSPVLKVGEDIPDGAPLMISYHRHAYGLGEHYNSLIPK